MRILKNFFKECESRNKSKFSKKCESRSKSKCRGMRSYSNKQNKQKINKQNKQNKPDQFCVTLMKILFIL